MVLLNIIRGALVDLRTTKRVRTTSRKTERDQLLNNPWIHRAGAGSIV